MNEETLYELILRWLAQQGGGSGPPTMLVDTPWGRVEVVDDLAPIYEDTATVNGYGGGNPEFYDGGMRAEQLIGQDLYGTWQPQTPPAEPWPDYDPYAGGALYDAFGGTTTGDMSGSNIGVYTGPLIEEENRKVRPRTESAPLGVGIEAIVNAANALAATQRNTMPSLGRGLATAMQTSVAQPTTKRTMPPTATQRNIPAAAVRNTATSTYRPAPVVTPAPPPANWGRSAMRYQAPTGLATLRNRSR